MALFIFTTQNANSSAASGTIPKHHYRKGLLQTFIGPGISVQMFYPYHIMDAAKTIVHGIFRPFYRSSSSTRVVNATHIVEYTFYFFDSRSMSSFNDRQRVSTRPDDIADDTYANTSDGYNHTYGVNTDSLDNSLCANSHSILEGVCSTQSPKSIAGLDAIDLLISSGHHLQSLDTSSSSAGLSNPNQRYNLSQRDEDDEGGVAGSDKTQNNIGRQPNTAENKDRLSSASMPQLRRQRDNVSSTGFTKPTLPQQVNRSDINTDQKQKPRRRRQDKGQLYPQINSQHYGGDGSPSSAPSSPITPGSTRSVRSRHSSIRRKAAMSIITEAAAVAEEIADLQNFKITCRNLSSYRVVHLFYQTDVDLFDAIQEWKDNHPTLWVDDAINAFATAKGSDALAQLVYSTEAFDVILKYDASNEHIEPIFEDIVQADKQCCRHATISHCCEQCVLHYPSTTGTADVLPDAPHSLNAASAVESLMISKQVSPIRSQLQESPAKNVSRSFSLKTSQTQGRSRPDRQGLEGIPHISLPMPSHNNNSNSSDKNFQLLESLDCSTNLFPSPRSSTVAAEEDGHYMCDGGKQSEDMSDYRDPTLVQSFLSVHQQSYATTDHEGRERQPYGKRRIQRPSKAELREWKIQLHRRDFQLALLKEGLFLELEKSINSDAVYIKVLAPFWRLGEEAQKTSCKADLARTILPSIPYASRIFPRITRLFPCLDQPGLEQRREAVLFKVERLTDFHLAEPGRRWCDVVRHSGGVQRDGSHLKSNTGIDGRPGFFQTGRRGYLVKSIMMRTRSRKHPYGRKMGLRSALRHGVYQKLYALHDGSFKTYTETISDLNHRAQLRIKWAKRFWGSQPLDLVNTYFGERTGIYFAWLGHYTKWLTMPAVVGVAVFVFGIINASRSKKLDATPNALFAIFDNALTMPFALFMSIWSTVYIEFWKRANQYYAFRWNMNDYGRVELPRTEFRATRARYSPVTGKRELYYPHYWKAFRILASSIAVFLAVVIVVASVACLMIFKAWCRYHFGGPYAAVVATAMLNLVIIIVLGEIWCRLAEWLTDKENHKYTDAYEDSLIIKRYLFDFTNMYATLFYYAFFKAPFGNKIFKHRLDLQDECMYDACITELTVQLAVVFIGKQFLNGLFEMVFPWMLRTWNRKKILADQALKRRILLESRRSTRAPQWVKDDDLPSYEGRILKCYRKTVVQFGFCTLFVTSFPVAPAFALINNWIDIRMEAFRLLTQYRRPIALRAQDIGMWEKIMEFISFVSVITNAAIIAFSSLWVKQHLFVKWLKVSSEGELLAARLGFILVFEHVVYLFKFILRTAIPTVPLTIKLAVQRSKYMTRVASEGLDSELDESLDLDIGSDSQSENESDESDFEKSQNTAEGTGGYKSMNIQRHPSDKDAQGTKKLSIVSRGIRRVWRKAGIKKKNRRGHQELTTPDHNAFSMD
ncbi:Anoctamin-4 [Mortierella sp. AM989]|nr:Anoctamin-4 [Mortierella sp. AM989]